MNEAILREYAELIVKIGANVQKGQRVRLQTGVDQVQLATMVTEECYKAGASYVEVIWECGPINKLNYQYASAETLGTVQTWEEERLKQMTVDLPVRIFIDSSDPDELAGISADLLSTVRQMRGKVTKKIPRSARRKTSVADRCRSVTGMGQKSIPRRAGGYCG